MSTQQFILQSLLVVLGASLGGLLAPLLLERFRARVAIEREIATLRVRKLAEMMAAIGAEDISRVRLALHTVNHFQSEAAEDAFEAYSEQSGKMIDVYVSNRFGLVKVCQRKLVVT